MDIIDAFHAHSLLKPGFTICDLDELPGKDEAAYLAQSTGAVMFPIFNEVSGAFSIPASDAGHGDETLTVQFLCLVRKAEESYDVQSIAPAVVERYQDYRKALIANPDLAIENVNSGLASDVVMSAQFSVFEWPAGGGDFWLGFQVTHTWDFKFDNA